MELIKLINNPTKKKLLIDNDIMWKLRRLPLPTISALIAYAKRHRKKMKSKIALNKIWLIQHGIKNG